MRPSGDQRINNGTLPVLAERSSTVDGSMTEAYDQRPVTLRVHLGGAIAFVPEYKTLWALMPNAFAPAQARWPRFSDALSARSSHAPLLIMDHELFDREASSGRVKVVYEAEEDTLTEGLPYPLTPGAKVAIDLKDDELDFNLDGNSVHLHPETACVPRMKEISRRHRYVSSRFHPRNNYKHFRSYVSAAFHLKSGELSVEGYFGGRMPNGEYRKVSFGYVYSLFGKRKFYGKTWKKPVANHLLWTLQYPPGTSITLTKRPLPGQPQERERTYVLKVPESRQIDIAILHTEPEAPFLFLDDPILPTEIAKFPDPDFEMFYQLSDKAHGWRPWRVPVAVDVPAGGDEKTCANLMAQGFRG